MSHALLVVLLGLPVSEARWKSEGPRPPRLPRPPPLLGRVPLGTWLLLLL